MARIAIGGWQHETNTFAPIKADFPSFEEANDWPGLCRGQALFTETDGVHLPITGALHALRAAGHERLSQDASSFHPPLRFGAHSKCWCVRKSRLECRRGRPD